MQARGAGHKTAQESTKREDGQRNMGRDILSCRRRLTADFLGPLHAATGRTTERAADGLTQTDNKVRPRPTLRSLDEMTMTDHGEGTFGENHASTGREALKGTSLITDLAERLSAWCRHAAYGRSDGSGLGVSCPPPGQWPVEGSLYSPGRPRRGVVMSDVPCFPVGLPPQHEREVI